MNLIKMKDGDYVRYRLKGDSEYFIGQARSFGYNSFCVKRHYPNHIARAFDPSLDYTYDELGPLFCEEVEILSEQEYFKEKLRGR